MSVVASVQDVGPCKKRLRVEIPASEVGAETDRVVREWGRRARIPGFRKGHVPAAVVKQRYKADIDREVVERLLPAWWEKAKEESGIHPLASPEVDEVGDLTAGEGLSFTASVEVRPEIALGDLDGFDLPDPAVEPSDEEVDEALDGIRRGVGDWKSVERPAARGDRVAARISEVTAGEEGPATDASEAAEPVESTEAAPSEPGEEAVPAGHGKQATEPQEITVEVGDPNVWEELSLAVTGLSVGQEGKFTRRPAGDDAPARSFRVVVDRVEERELPPLDDALAARVGDFATVEALREQVVENLRRHKGSERRRSREGALLEQLRTRYPIALPQGVVRHEIEHLLGDYAAEMGRAGLDPEKAQVDWNALGEQVRPQAERRVHDRLLLDAVADHESLTVDDADLEGMVTALARAQKTNPGLLRRRLAEDGRLDRLRADLRRSRAVQHLLGEDPEPAGGPATEPRSEPDPEPDAPPVPPA